MLQIVDKSEIAARKPYRYSSKVLERMRKAKKAKERKKQNMARKIIRIDTLTEIIEENDPTDKIFGVNILNNLLD
jgi:hypothetical protein